MSDLFFPIIGNLANAAVNVFGQYEKDNPNNTWIDQARLDGSDAIDQAILTAKTQTSDPTGIPSLVTKATQDYMAKVSKSGKFNANDLQQIQNSLHAYQRGTLSPVQQDIVNYTVNKQKGADMDNAARMADKLGLDAGLAHLDQVGTGQVTIPTELAIPGPDGQVPAPQTKNTAYWTPQGIQAAKEVLTNRVGTDQFKQAFSLDPVQALKDLKAGTFGISRTGPEGKALPNQGRINEDTQKALIPLYQQKLNDIITGNGNERLSTDSKIQQDYNNLIASGVKPAIAGTAISPELYKNLQQTYIDAQKAVTDTNNLQEKGLVSDPVLKQSQITLDKVSVLFDAVNEKLKGPMPAEKTAALIAQMRGDYLAASQGLRAGLSPDSQAWNDSVNKWLETNYKTNPIFKGAYAQGRAEVLGLAKSDSDDLQKGYLSPLVTLKQDWAVKLKENSTLADQAYQLTVNQDAQARTNSASGNARASDPALLSIRYQQNLYNLLSVKGVDTMGLNPINIQGDALGDRGVKAYNEMLAPGSARQRGLGTSADENVLDAITKGKALMTYDTMPKSQQQAFATATNGLANGFARLAPDSAMSFSGIPASKTEVVPTKDQDGNFALVVRGKDKDGTIQQRFFVPQEVNPGARDLGGPISTYTWIEADPKTGAPKEGALPIVLADKPVRDHPYKNVPDFYKIGAW